MPKRACSTATSVRFQPLALCSTLCSVPGGHPAYLRWWKVLSSEIPFFPFLIHGPLASHPLAFRSCFPVPPSASHRPQPLSRRRTGRSRQVASGCLPSVVRVMSESRRLGRDRVTVSDSEGGDPVGRRRLRSDRRIQIAPKVPPPEAPRLHAIPHPPLSVRCWERMMNLPAQRLISGTEPRHWPVHRESHV